MTEYLLKVLADIRQAIGNTDKLMLNELAPFINKRVAELEAEVKRLDDMRIKQCNTIVKLISDGADLTATNKKLLDASKNVSERCNFSPVSKEGFPLFVWPISTSGVSSINALKEVIKEIEGKQHV